MNFLLPFFLVLLEDLKSTVRSRQAANGDTYLGVDNGRGRELVQTGGGQRSEASHGGLPDGLLWGHDSFRLTRKVFKKMEHVLSSLPANLKNLRG